MDPKTIPKRALAAFHPGQAGDDTIRLYLEKGFSLVICCKVCERLVEWTPPELLERFGDKRGLQIADLAVRLMCAGDDGCGSHDIAVFPHLCDDPLQWMER